MGKKSKKHKKEKSSKKMASKKATPNKAVKKARPVAKKTVKKQASKKATPKKVVKKARPVAKKTINKQASKKATPKKVVKEAKPVVKKTVNKQVSKQVISKKVIKKATPVAKKAIKTAKPVAIKETRKAEAKPIAKKTVSEKVVKITETETKPVQQTAPAPKAEQAKAIRPPSRSRASSSGRHGGKSAFSQFSNPVDLSTIPDYVPETPAIENKEVVKSPSKGKQKEDNRNRYSEKELAEFKGILLEKLEQAQKDYELLKNTLCHTDDHGTDDTSPTFKMLEDGSDVLTREETAQLALRQEKFIQNLKNALVRIENKTYGICRVSGKLIPKERLRRVPHATLSIDAKLEQQYNT